MAVSIRIDTRDFNATVQKLLEHSRSELPKILNKAGFSIAQTAVAVTKRAEKSVIRKYLNQQVVTNNGRTAPLAALIVNKRRGVGRGLYGEQMREAMNLFIQNQADSVNFLRAGWLSAMAKFARALGKPVGANAQRFLARFGYKWGEGRAAQKGIAPVAYMANMAFSRHTSTDNGIKFAQSGLQRAVNQQTDRMRKWIEDDMQKMTNRVVGRIFR
jgi:hypothetical protein